MLNLELYQKRTLKISNLSKKSEEKNAKEGVGWDNTRAEFRTISFKDGRKKFESSSRDGRMRVSNFEQVENVGGELCLKMGCISLISML